MDSIKDDTKQRLTKNSIYRRQAISITDINSPEIMDLSSIDKEMMVLSKKTTYALNPIRARIERPEDCVRSGIPLKYGCLLAGGLTY